MAVVVYPVNFPAPRIAPYAWEVDMGVLRTPMDGGLARQRRLYDVMPHAYALQFALPITLLFDWQSWVNQYAYDYFELPLISWLSSQAATKTSVHIARFTSNLKIEFNPNDAVLVSVSAELSPAQVSNYAPTLLEDWMPPP